jgi:hypothetical protein
MASPVALSAALAARRRWLPTVEPVLMALATASVMAAAIHAAVSPAHFQEATAFGAFFALSAMAQAVWAGWVVARPTPAVLRVGAAGNLAAAAVWLMTRTSGLPLGPAPWHREPVGTLDGLTVLIEVALAVVAVRCLAANSEAVTA